MKNKNGFYSIKNKNGIEIQFTEKGGKLMAYKIPTSKGVIDIMLGYSSYPKSEQGDVYFGSICGRVANRILGGAFTINGKSFQANQNVGTNTLHGGEDGFWNRVWNVKKEDENSYALSLESPNLDQGFPGDLSAKAVYTLTNNNELIIDFTATANKDTIVNLASHPYFNLKGEGNGNVLDHLLELNAQKYTPMSNEFVPTGELQEVTNTPFDFTKPKALNKAVHSPHPQIELAGQGVDHNFVLNKPLNEFGLAAIVTHPKSPITLKVYTTQPGLQVYLAMHFNNSEVGKQGKPYAKYGGIALEAQNFPDAIHHSHFPSPVLRKGEVYKHRVVYKVEVAY